MTREETARLLPIMEAYARGEVVQFKDVHGEWLDLDGTNEPSWCFDVFEYRIKPQLKVRPFKNATECWNEMLKHQPFGWLRSNGDDMVMLGMVSSTNEEGENKGGGGVVFYDGDFLHFTDAVNNKFADGAPFGVAEQ